MPGSVLRRVEAPRRLVRASLPDFGGSGVSCDSTASCSVTGSPVTAVTGAESGIVGLATALPGAPALSGIPAGLLGGVTALFVVVLDGSGVTGSVGGNVIWLGDATRSDVVS